MPLFEYLIVAPRALSRIYNAQYKLKKIDGQEMVRFNGFAEP